MNRAGKASYHRIFSLRHLVLMASVALAAAPLVAQTQPAPALVGTGGPNAERQSSMTVQQIVARQEAHFATIKNAQGIVTYTDVSTNPQGQALPASSQYIFFAYAGDKSVTLAMPSAAADIYKSSQGQVPWKHITSACFVAGETVYIIEKPEGKTTAPRVIATPFNPAVHENNPLVAFHPRQVSDEQVPLRELARAIPQMAQRPTVSDVVSSGMPLLRIDFANPSKPGEHLDYFVDPARGYLPVEITRTSQGRPVSVSRITIGNTPDGTWIPARRERTVYAPNGTVASRQSWHYEYLAVNKGLAPQALSLMFFNLPLNTKIEVAGGKAGQKPALAPQQPVTPPQPRRVTPVPTRVAPTPVRVPLP